MTPHGSPIIATDTSLKHARRRNRSVEKNRKAFVGCFFANRGRRRGLMSVAVFRVPRASVLASAGLVFSSAFWGCLLWLCLFVVLLWPAVAVRAVLCGGCVLACRRWCRRGCGVLAVLCLLGGRRRWRRLGGLACGPRVFCWGGLCRLLALSGLALLWGVCRCPRALAAESGFCCVLRSASAGRFFLADLILGVNSRK